MKYSVLITVYDKDNPKYFEQALKSMINQSVKPSEIVIVKDGKINHNLSKVINDNKKIFKKIVEVDLSKNVGLGLALNEGIKKCKYNLIARMDSDDISFLDRCEKQLEKFEQNKNLDIVGCPVLEFKDDIASIVGKRKVPLTNEEIYKYARRRDPFNHPTVMYKKDSVLAVGGYGNYRKNQDTDLWIKMLHNKCQCANCEEYLLYFRFDDNTYKKRKSWTNTKLLIKIRWNAYKIGFCSFFDFLSVMIIQLGIFIMPLSFQKFVYRKFLRK